MFYWTLQTLNGLSLAAVLCLLASGLSLIFGLMNVLNLAHGSFYVIGGYVGWAIMEEANNFLLGAVVGIVSAALVGALMQRYLISRIQNAPSAQVLLTFGILLIVADIQLWLSRGRIRILDKPALFDGAVDLGIVIYPKYRLSLF